MPTSQELLDLQNPDGGWSYRRGGGSWTEPTCYALLALASDGLAGSDRAQRGVTWLAAQHRSGGGWAPRAGVDESTWVAALVLLLPDGSAEGLDRKGASAWLLAQTGRESSRVQRLRLRLLGIPIDPTQSFDGWPWYPGAAAWVTPTALTILALEKLEREEKLGREEAGGGIRERIAQGRSFLLSRRCRDGGWNHGSTRALGYDSDSYPETTGLALLALHRADATEMEGAVGVAERHLASCKTLEGACWLTLGLLARGRSPAARVLDGVLDGVPDGVPDGALAGHGNTIELALATLVRAAHGGHNLFVE